MLEAAKSGKRVWRVHKTRQGKQSWVSVDMAKSSKKLANQEMGTATKNLAIFGSTSSKVTHEVGNLLNNVGLTLSTLKKERLSPQGERAVSILEKESKRVKRFIRNLLQLAKAPDLYLARQPVDRIIQEVLFVHEYNAERRGIHLELKWPPDLPPVHIDAHLIYQVLNNLVKNSLEAMTGPGKITIEGSRDPKFLVIKIEDTGPGMGRAVLQRIFDPFFTTKGRKGTGLGLSVVKTVVEAHSGRVECQTDPGKGTRFTLRLPQE